jgi:membrane protease YdiL (CAAX protease family)
VGVILTYLKRPHYIRNTDIIWSVFLKSWILIILFTLPLGPVIEIIKKVASINETDFNYSPFIIFLSTVLVAPVIEELFFRLILKPRFINCIVFSIFSWLLTIILLYKKIFFLFVPIFVLSVIELIVLLDKKLFRKMQKSFLIHFCFVFYLSIFIFGFLHITNYEPFNCKLIAIMPILVSPVLIASIFLGFIRMKFGIFYSILLHSMINLIGFLGIIIDK